MDVKPVVQVQLKEITGQTMYHIYEQTLLNGRLVIKDEASLVDILL